MLVPAYNVARLVEYLTRYRLNGATVTAKDGAWSIVRPSTERDPDYTAITIRRDGHVMIYFGDARSCIDAATEVKCGVCTSAIDAERMILNALDTLAHDVYAQARADRDTAASVHTECPACGGAGVFASRSGGNVCECCGGTGHDTGCECAGCEAARAPRCHKCGRTDDLHVQDGTATCHPCMLDDDLARHFADQRRRAADDFPTGMHRVSGTAGGDGIFRITY